MHRSWWLALSLALGCRAGAFACDEPDDCAGASDAGICQADGWCSFPADDCPSGHRYGEHAGDGLAGTCVDANDGTTTTATTDDSKSTSVETTITETSLVTSDADTTMTASTAVDTSESSTMPDPTTDDTMTTDPGSECGNGVVEPGEACDHGDANGNGGPCRDDCMLNVCGDGYLGDGEQCEPSLRDSCTESCTLTTCGDGELGPEEQCDPLVPLQQSCVAHGFPDGVLVCTARCTISTAGCEGCGDDGCQFPQCFDGCPANEKCVSYGKGEVCTATCHTDDDCVSEVVGVLCENEECVIPCEFQDDCPFDMMACFNGQCAYPA